MGLMDLNVDYPLTIIYMPLRWCGFTYRFFEFVLGHNQYYQEDVPAIPENRLFAQFRAAQTTQMENEILPANVLCQKYCKSHFCNYCNWNGC